MGIGPDDLTTEILISIRDEVRGLGARIDDTNERLDGTNGKLGDLTRRVVESELRTTTAITELAGTVRDLTFHLRTQNDLRPRVERCERDIDDIKRTLAG
jgi:uncharacterized protein Yka (UPF0111/DUF47 family)